MARETVQYPGTGRRKTSHARVYLRPGTGRIFINKREVEEYFDRPSLVLDLRRPFQLTETGQQFDTFVNVAGGGLAAQAGAVRLGIARALLVFNADLRTTLKRDGLLTRDARKVERKKYGQPGARRRFQFSKR